MPTIVLIVLTGLALWGTARITRRVAADGVGALQPTPQMAVGVIAGVLICGIWFGVNIRAITAPLKPVPDGYAQVPGIDVQYGNGIKLDDADFRAADQLIPKDAHIFVARKPGTIEDVTVWTYTRLAPRIPVATPAQADWIIFVDGTAPTDPAYSGMTFDRAQTGKTIQFLHIQGRP